MFSVPRRTFLFPEQKELSAAPAWVFVPGGQQGKPSEFLLGLFVAALAVLEKDVVEEALLLPRVLSSYAQLLGWTR